MSDQTEIVLTDEQASVVEKVISWYKDSKSKQTLTLGGYAGTGKTTVIREIQKQLKTLLETQNETDYTYDDEESESNPIAITAFTGKATSVLCRKGLDAQTLHSLMYQVREDANHKLLFIKRNQLDGDPNVVIVDESSMISKDLYIDLLSYGHKVLFVGDHGQLEPIGDNPNLMKSPELTLTTILRQAESSPILNFATKVRQNKRFGLEKTPGLNIIGKHENLIEVFKYVDQVLVAYNRTRISFNRQIRGLNKMVGLISEGEKLICLRNDRRLGLFNGLFLVVSKIHETKGHTILVDAEDDLGIKHTRLQLWLDPFQREIEFKERVPSEHAWCDYGYAITVHKAQGSEWDKVYVHEEYCPKWDMSRWRYTAATRASKELIYGI